MGDRHHGARIVMQETFEPGDGFGVEMVGRLVEQQQIRLAQQQPAKRHPAALAARQRCDLRIRRRASERVHGDLGLAIEVPGVRRVDPLLQRALFLDQGIHRIVVERLGEFGAHRLETREQVARFGHAFEHIGEHVPGRVERGFLREMADPDRGRDPGLAEIFGLDPSHDPEQGRLAGAVEPEHADLGPRQEGQGDVLEDLPAARIGLAEPLHDIDVLR